MRIREKLKFKGGSHHVLCRDRLAQENLLHHDSDEMGRIVAKANLLNHEDTILKSFKELKEKTKIVIESMSCWYWLYDLLIENGFEVVISNPLKTKAIASAKIKNDKLDSHMLMQLFRPGLISTIHMSSLETHGEQMHIFKKLLWTKIGNAE